MSLSRMPEKSMTEVHCIYEGEWGTIREVSIEEIATWSAKKLRYFSSTI